MATEISYESVGDPDDESTVPSRQDRQRQDRIERFPNEIHWHPVGHHVTGHCHGQWEPGHTHENDARYGPVGPAARHPEPDPAKMELAAQLVLAGLTKPLHELMRWRLRLFCGHVIERTSHRSHPDVHRAFSGRARCPTCDQDMVILAGKPAGLAGEPPPPRQPTPTETARTLERKRKRLARIEAEAAELRSELGAEP